MALFCARWRLGCSPWCTRRHGIWIITFVHRRYIFSRDDLSYTSFLIIRIVRSFFRRIIELDLHFYLLYCCWWHPASFLMISFWMKVQVRVMRRGGTSEGEGESWRHKANTSSAHRRRQLKRWVHTGNFENRRTHEEGRCKVSAAMLGNDPKWNQSQKMVSAYYIR